MVIFKMMILSIITISFYHPSDDEYKYYNFKEFYLSSELFNCVLITIVGIFLIIIFKVKRSWISNLAFNKCNLVVSGCDVLSGLFSTIPNLSNFYKIMDSNHLSKDKNTHWMQCIGPNYLFMFLYLIYVFIYT